MKCSVQYLDLSGTKKVEKGGYKVISNSATCTDYLVLLGYRNQGCYWQDSHVAWMCEKSEREYSV
jgi:hypothetical protein